MEREQFKTERSGERGRNGHEVLSRPEWAGTGAFWAFFASVGEEEAAREILDSVTEALANVEGKALSVKREFEFLSGVKEDIVSRKWGSVLKKVGQKVEELF